MGITRYRPSAGIIRIRFCGSSAKRSSQPVQQAPRSIVAASIRRSMPDVKPMINARGVSTPPSTAGRPDRHPNPGRENRSSSG